ncbi:MAG TPA: lamin tail domain-containing protein [Pyrinomonadaceae bacterium]|nr:lamin tail domain-containing protein [Pyrinomonadaceae bacterium]
MTPNATPALHFSLSQLADTRLLLLPLLCLCLLALPRAAAAQSAEADLTVTKFGEETVPVGGQINYTIVVINGGPDAASNVVVTDPIPPHTDYVSATSDAGQVTFANNTVTAAFAQIPAYESASLTLVVKVRSDTPRNTTIRNTATVASDTFDPFDDNNSSTATTLVVGPFAGDLLISEFRFRGPGGAADEYVEIYNNTDSAVSVSAADNSSGWAVAASDGTARFVIPNGTSIPARGHYLAVNSGGYSLGAYPAGAGTGAAGDVTYAAGINDDGGVALFRTSDPAKFDSGHLLDAVGFSSVTNALYREGGGLGSPVSSNAEHAFVRKLISGMPQDTGDNAADFFLVATAGSSPPAGAQLGAPGPENSESPLMRGNQIPASLIEPAAAASDPPNRVRSGSGGFDSLSIRRRFTNETGEAITRLRFRVVDLTTLGTPVTVAPQADLRLLTSGDTTAQTSRGALLVQGTRLEQPPLQRAGGGINSSVTAELPDGGLAPGATLDVQFLLHIVQTGRFRFFIVVEALGAQTEEELSPIQGWPADAGPAPRPERD